MRISDSILSNNYLHTLNNAKEQLEKLRVQAATQSKINRPSDSPAGTSKLLRVNNSIQQTNTFKSNISNSRAFVEETIGSMETIHNEITKVLTSLTGLNNSVNDENLDRFADEIDASLTMILEAANVEYNGKYLFAGTDHEGQPFGYDAAETNIEQKVGDTAGEHKILISKNIKQKINITGDELFGNIDGTDIFNTLRKVRDDLRSGIRPDEATVNSIQDFSKHLLNKTSEIGNVSKKLDDVEEVLNNQMVTLEELAAKENGVDVAATIMELQHQDYLLNLSYKMSAMILPKTLMDFI